MDRTGTGWLGKPESLAVMSAHPVLLTEVGRSEFSLKSMVVWHWLADLYWHLPWKGSSMAKVLYGALLSKCDTCSPWWVLQTAGHYKKVNKTTFASQERPTIMIFQERVPNT